MGCKKRVLECALSQGHISASFVEERKAVWKGERERIVR